VDDDRSYRHSSVRESRPVDDGLLSEQNLKSQAVLDSGHIPCQFQTAGYKRALV
jgi:hypothetical protein